MWLNILLSHLRAVPIVRALKNKIALVTGASQGIGRETALELARAGCPVLVTARSKPALEQTAQDIEGLGRRSQAIVADLSYRSQVEEMCHRAIDAFGRVEILVNNAGAQWGGRLEEMSIEDIESMIAVNLWPYIYTTKFLLPQMLERGEGHLVYLSSLAGVWGVGLSPPYVTSKFAIVGFAEAIAAQVRSSGIGVTVACPGFVRTQIIDSYQVIGGEATQAAFSRARHWVGSHYVMKPERVAEKIVRGIRRNRFFLLTHPESRLLLWSRAMFPGFLARINSWITDRVLPR
jgi:short-subunit dehydrogenase